MRDIAATAARVARVLGATAALALVLAGCAQDDEPLEGGTMLPSAFPIVSVVLAMEESLPEGASVDELPRDISWQPGNELDVPILRDGIAGTVTVTVPGTDVDACTADSEQLSQDEAAAVADAVCQAWDAEGRLPIVVPDPDAPPTENPEDAAR